MKILCFEILSYYLAYLERFLVKFMSNLMIIKRSKGLTIFNSNSCHYLLYCWVRRVSRGNSRVSQYVVLDESSDDGNISSRFTYFEIL